MRSTKHICTLPYNSQSNLPQPSKSFPSFYRTLRKLTIISPKNKQCHKYFRSTAAISLERKRHVESDLLIIIHPFSIFRLYWEAALTVIYLLGSILNPLDAAFSISERGWTVLSAIIFILNFLCVVDIALDFITGYGNDIAKEVVLDPKKIMIKHFQDPVFYLQVLSCMPLMIIRYFQGHGNVIITTLSLFKVFRISKFATYFGRASDIWQLNALGYAVIKYSILALLLVHWTGCLRCIVSEIVCDYYNMPSERYWNGSYLISGSTVDEQYIRFIFEVSLVLFNISYGTHWPTTKMELIMTIITFIIGTLYMATMLVLILQNMASSLSAETKYQEIVNQVQEYMKCKQLPIVMQKRLISYYEYHFKKKYFRKDLILASLSVRLRREINVYCYRRLIESVSIFKYMPQNLVVEVVNNLKEEIFLPNDIIVKANSIGDCMYFIASGTVCVTTPSGKEVCHLYDGAYFGEVSLLMKDHKRIANVFALEICELYKLDRKHFKNCFLHDTDLYRRLEKTANIRIEKTAILEDLYQKYLLSLEGHSGL